MPPLVTVPRTAVHAWLPSAASSPLDGPLVATATAAHALDDADPDSAHLELWAPFSSHDSPPSPLARIHTHSPAHRIAWGPWQPPPAYSTDGTQLQGMGILATGHHSGQVTLYDPAKLVAGQE